MKTLQLRKGRWFAIAGPDGSTRYHPVVAGMTCADMAKEVDELEPPLVHEVLGTGMRLADVVQLEAEDWKVFGNDAQALSSAAFRLIETAR